MKKKILLCLVCCGLMASMLSGCTNYEDITNILGQIRIENELPEVLESNYYESLSDIDELVYEQQIAACEMYIDACRQTNHHDYFEGTENSSTAKSMTNEERKIANLVTQRRHVIYEDINVALAVNLYRLLQNVEDCPNVDAYVTKAQDDVVNFFDMYDAYVYGDDQEGALLNILIEYRVRTNVLAFMFLDKNKEAVCEAAARRIASNSEMTEDLRMYVSNNNDIIKSLNEIYGSVPAKYAEQISSDANFLAKKLVLSMESLSNKEKLDLINQIDPTPTPTPTPSPTPKPTLSPSATPSADPMQIIPSTPVPTQSGQTVTQPPLIFE